MTIIHRMGTFECLDPEVCPLIDQMLKAYIQYAYNLLCLIYLQKNIKDLCVIGWWLNKHTESFISSMPWCWMQCLLWFIQPYIIFYLTQLLILMGKASWKYPHSVTYQLFSKHKINIYSHIISHTSNISLRATYHYPIHSFRQYFQCQYHSGPSGTIMWL